MSAYTSLKITRQKAVSILLREITMGTDDQLKDLLNKVLMRDTLYNCYEIVSYAEENDDDRL